MSAEIFSGQVRKNFDFEALAEPNFEKLLDFLFGFPKKSRKHILTTETSIFHKYRGE